VVATASSGSRGLLAAGAATAVVCRGGLGDGFDVGLDFLSRGWCDSAAG